MSKDNSEYNNPGQQLQKLLKDIYPVGDLPSKSFISRLDHATKADGELILLIYYSSINYLVRRLIRTAQYIYNNAKDTSDLIYFQDLREYLNKELEIPKAKIEGIFILLVECVSNSEKKPSQLTKDRLIKRAREDNQKCSICGCELDYLLPDKFNSAEVEHSWPNSLGGNSDYTNLSVCCRTCNQAKRDYMDSNDFHYEEISFNVEDFPSDIEREHKVALLAKNNYQCNHGRCNASPNLSGKLTFKRKNPEDSWHYLNIETYCSEHS